MGSLQLTVLKSVDALVCDHKDHSLLDVKLIERSHNLLEPHHDVILLIFT